MCLSIYNAHVIYSCFYVYTTIMKNHRFPSFCYFVNLNLLYFSLFFFYHYNIFFTLEIMMYILYIFFLDICCFDDDSIMKSSSIYIYVCAKKYTYNIIGIIVIYAYQSSINICNSSSSSKFASLKSDKSLIASSSSSSSVVFTMLLASVAYLATYS